jgi:hypothetical protein
MSLRIDLKVEGLAPEDLAMLKATLQNPAPLHAKIAGDAETFIKKAGPGIASQNHRSANRLGATPTGHLDDAYQAIEGSSTAAAAVLTIPRASRLRAAFGAYAVRPTKSKYLTIPVHKDAYGKRAREIDDLFPLRVGPRKTLVLARRDESAGPSENQRFLTRARPGQRRAARRRDTGIETMYVLVTSADIPAQPDLIPFEKLENEGIRSVEEFLDDAIEAALTE